jgi:hypothetical protein
MRHRHLTDHPYWSYAKIDDVLDRGTLADWRELRDAAQADADVAKRIFCLAKATNRYGTSALWISAICAMHPQMQVDCD